MAQVAITFPGFPLHHPEISEILAKAGLEPRLVPLDASAGPEDVVQACSGCAAAIVTTEPYDGAVFSQLPSLRVVARVGVGYDRIDVEAARRNGVDVWIARGSSEVSVAEHTMALILSLLRRTPTYDRMVREGRWDRVTGLGSDLAGRTVGLVGLGTIGSHVRRRLEAFDARVLVTDPALTLDREAGVVVLDELLEASSIVSVHVPLTRETHGLIGAQEIAKMRPGSYLVNTARGNVVDEDAVIAALESGHLAGAAIDVFRGEPKVDPRLRRQTNVVLTPHVAGMTVESRHRMALGAARAVSDLIMGKPKTGSGWLT